MRMQTYHYVFAFPVLFVPIFIISIALVYGSIYMNSPEIRKKNHNTFITYLGKRSNMFTFLLVPFALLRQNGSGLSRQGKPFSSTVFHLRESLLAEFKVQSTKLKPTFITRTGIQTDSLKPRCDWLTLSRMFSRWLRAPSSQKQFENPPQTHSFIFSLYLNSILLRPKNSKIVPHSSFGFLIRFSPSLICISLLFNKHCDLTVRSTEFTCTMCYVF